VSAAPRTIIWRLNEPTEEPRYRPTKIHAIDPQNDARTLCGLAIPEWPHDTTYDEPLDPGPGSCQRCRRKAVR